MFSIFIASTTASGWPASTLSPSPTFSETSRPGIGQMRNRERSGGIFSIMCVADAQCGGQDAHLWIAPRVVIRKPVRVWRDLHAKRLVSDIGIDHPVARRIFDRQSTGFAIDRTSSLIDKAHVDATFLVDLTASRIGGAARRPAARRSGARDPPRGGDEPGDGGTACAAVGSDAGAPWKPSGYSSAMKPVVSSPERKRGCCMIAETKSMLWPSPSISNRSSAAICLSAASSRVLPQVISLAIIGS
jgi:hypothetical protein